MRIHWSQVFTQMYFNCIFLQYYFVEQVVLARAVVRAFSSHDCLYLIFVKLFKNDNMWRNISSIWWSKYRYYRLLNRFYVVVPFDEINPTYIKLDGVTNKLTDFLNMNIRKFFPMTTSPAHLTLKMKNLYLKP